MRYTYGQQTSVTATKCPDGKTYRSETAKKAETSTSINGCRDATLSCRSLAFSSSFIIILAVCSIFSLPSTFITSQATCVQLGNTTYIFYSSSNHSEILIIRPIHLHVYHHYYFCITFTLLFNVVVNCCVFCFSCE